MSKVFAFCALKQLSSLSSGGSRVSLALAKRGGRGEAAPRSRPAGPRSPGSCARSRWQRLTRPACRLAQDTGSRLQAAPQTRSLTFASCSGQLFFPLLPRFCSARFNCNLLRAGSRCVYKGLRTTCPRWCCTGPSRQPRGFTVQERNFEKSDTSFQRFVFADVAGNFRARVSVPGFGDKGRRYHCSFCFFFTPTPPSPFFSPRDCREKLVNAAGADCSKPDGK